MRIMTYAVRQALAMSNGPDQHLQRSLGSSPSSSLSSKSSQGSSSATKDGSRSDVDALIPCAAKRPAGPDEPPSKKARFEAQFLDKDSLPPNMEKYGAECHRLFSKFDQGIKLDLESWYSVTPEKIAQQIAARCSCSVIVDGFCGSGGNSIQFALTCEKVIAIDIDPNKIELAKSNAKIYEVEHRIEFVCADFVQWIQHQEPGSIDVIFLSPPWGGVDYLALNTPYYSLNDLKPVNGRELIMMSHRVTPDIAIYLPRHMDLIELGQLDLGDSQSSKPNRLEVEEEWMGRKCKALTVYFGDLASNQT